MRCEPCCAVLCRVYVRMSCVLVAVTRDYLEVQNTPHDCGYLPSVIAHRPWRASQRSVVSSVYRRRRRVLQQRVDAV